MTCEYDLGNVDLEGSSDTFPGLLAICPGQTFALTPDNSDAVNNRAKSLGNPELNLSLVNFQFGQAEMTVDRAVECRLLEQFLGVPCWQSDEYCASHFFELDRSSSMADR